MENNLKYRENNYFNSEDLYLFDNNLGKLYLTKVHFHNGFWYSDVACKYKMNSVRCANCRELYGLNVELHKVRGYISKFLGAPNNDFGVQWQGVGDKGLNYFWNDVNLFQAFLV